MERKEFTDSLYRKMKEELTAIEMEGPPPIQRMNKALTCVDKYMEMLKTNISNHPFAGQDEEIIFFKHGKPRFYRWHIYHHELATLEVGMPIGSRKSQLTYLECELIHIERFFRQYQFQYQYFKIGATELDSLYFVRGAYSGSPLIPPIPEPEPVFSTKADYLFAKIRAFELLREWILERISMLKANSLKPTELIAGKKDGEMFWTGNTIHLGEIGYGFYLTRQLNNGTASINEIFRWLEEKLHVTIGKPAKRLEEIKARKRLSQTKYLDEMKDSIQQKIQRDNEYRPG